MTPGLYLPQRHHILTDYFLPDPRELAHGLLKWLVFDFGWVIAGDALGAFKTNQKTVVLEKNFLAWAITGNTSQAAPSLRAKLMHTHGDVQRDLMNKHQADGNLFGTASLPLPIRSPQLFLAEDKISCEVKNITNAANKAQIVLWGTELER